TSGTPRSSGRSSSSTAAKKASRSRCATIRGTRVSLRDAADGRKEREMPRPTMMEQLTSLSEDALERLGQSPFTRTAGGARGAREGGKGRRREAGRGPGRPGGRGEGDGGAPRRAGGKDEADEARRGEAGREAAEAADDGREAGRARGVAGAGARGARRAGVRA